MFFNLGKCNYLNSGKINNSFFFIEYEINKEGNQKDLQLFISSDPNWNSQTDAVCLKANRTLFLLEQKTNKLNPVAKLSLYKSIIKTVLLYARPCFWFKKYVLCQLEIFQKRMVNL